MLVEAAPGLLTIEDITCQLSVTKSWGRPANAGVQP